MGQNLRLIYSRLELRECGEIMCRAVAITAGWIHRMGIVLCDRYGETAAL